MNEKWQSYGENLSEEPKIIDLNKKMDALVSDLSHALDETQLPQYVKHRRAHKKRSKTCNAMRITIGQNAGSHIVSDVSSNSLEDVTHSQDKSSMPLSDSDDGSPLEERMRSLHFTHHRVSANLVESDSVNENLSPARLENRRKQKCKRLDFDPNTSTASTSGLRGIDRIQHGSIRKRKGIRHPADMECKLSEATPGKRKRVRSEIEAGRKSHRRPYSSSYATKFGIAKYKMDVEQMDFSAESNVEDSGDSDEGVLTCDEGREADDEHSDFFAESGPSYGVPEGGISQNNRRPWWNSEEMQFSPSTKASFKERYEKMSKESQQACRLRFRKLRERLMRREIRAGRRRLQDRRPGFSIVSSVNDKVSRFVRDSCQTELRLNPLNERDVVQLKHLADVYSLQFQSSQDLTSHILTKTSNTIMVRHFDGVSGAVPSVPSVSLNDQKRARRITPPSTSHLTEGSNDSVESVVNSNTYAGRNSRPPVPLPSWEGDDVADSLSERLADSEPEPYSSPSSHGLHVNL